MQGLLLALGLRVRWRGGTVQSLREWAPGSWGGAWSLGDAAPGLRWGTELPPEVTATPHLHSRQLAAELSRKGETGGAQVLV